MKKEVELDYFDKRNPIEPDYKIGAHDYAVVRNIYTLMIKDVSKERSLYTGNLDDKAYTNNLDRVCAWIYKEKENPNSLFWLTLKTKSDLFQDLGQMLCNMKLTAYPIDLEIGYRACHLNYITYADYEMDDPDCFFCTGCERCISDKTGEQILWVGDAQLRFKKWRDLYLKEVAQEEENRLETERDHQDPTSIFHDPIKKTNEVN